MCWRKDVKWEIHTSDDPKEFMSVTSGEYVLAIPDYSNEARYAQEATAQDLESISSSSEFKNATLFKKVVMKLSGDVRLVAGLVFERNIDGDKRSFEFRPHYDVILRNPEFIDSEERKARTIHLPERFLANFFYRRTTTPIAGSGATTFICPSRSLPL
jgi:hypothetical protein